MSEAKNKRTKQNVKPRGRTSWMSLVGREEKETAIGRLMSSWMEGEKKGKEPHW